MDEFYAEFTVLDWIFFPFQLLLLFFEQAIENGYWLSFISLLVIYSFIIWGIYLFIKNIIDKRQEAKFREEYDKKYDTKQVWMPHMADYFPVPVPKEEEE